MPSLKFNKSIKIFMDSGKRDKWKDEGYYQSYPQRSMDPFRFL